MSQEVTVPVVTHLTSCPRDCLPASRTTINKVTSKAVSAIHLGSKSYSIASTRDSSRVSPPSSSSHFLPLGTSPEGDKLLSSSTTSADDLCVPKGRAEAEGGKMSSGNSLSPTSRTYDMIVNGGPVSPEGGRGQDHPGASGLVASHTATTGSKVMIKTRDKRGHYSLITSSSRYHHYTHLTVLSSFN